MTLRTGALPGADLDVTRMPGHWLLARLGKRVLRPGGRELTERMLADLAISPADDVVEFAPGLGVTARRALAARPASYTGVERAPEAAEIVRGYLPASGARCVVGHAEETGLPGGSATVVYGEAMLTMQTAKGKVRIVDEARRLLRAGGRYGIHELALTPDTLDEGLKAGIERELSQAIHVGARPLTESEWRQLLADQGFAVTTMTTSPMHLLELRRMIQDEGILGVLRIAWNVLCDRQARARVLEMRRVFRKHARHLSAITIVATRTPAS
ncbi:class I SAM-dependent methyltransferase [Myxococcota bacterium]|nr:class I SAM-dependent methyltransferase [Myxococcota bacterium]